MKKLDIKLKHFGHFEAIMDRERESVSAPWCDGETIHNARCEKSQNSEWPESPPLLWRFLI